MCHPQFKPGPPSEIAQTASYFIYEVIQNSNLIDLKDLCIKPGKLVWAIYIDFTCLNYDGNILDVSIKALCAALRNLKLPHVEVKDKTEEEDCIVNPEEKEEIIVELNNMENFKLNKELPFSCTIAVFDGDKLLVDPTEEEEKISDSSVTVVVQVCFMICVIPQEAVKK